MPSYGVSPEKEAAYEAGFEEGYLGRTFKIFGLAYFPQWKIDTFYEGFYDGTEYRKRFDRGGLK